MNARNPAIAGILFDKDGTLLDFHRTWQPINEAALLFAAQGDAHLEDRLRSIGGLCPRSGLALPDTLLAAGTTHEIAEAFVAAGSRFEVTALTREIDRIFCAGAENAVPVVELAPMLARFKARGLKLGVASSDSEAGIMAMAARFGLDGLLDFISGYDSGHGAKPEPGMLLAFARHCNLSPGAIIVVGDNVGDMEMARRGGAGLRIGVLTGTGTAEQLTEAADVCLGSIAELEAVLFGCDPVQPRSR